MYLVNGITAYLPSLSLSALFAVPASTGRKILSMHVMQACDSFGNQRHSGHDSFTVQIQGVARDDIHVTDRHDGTYAVEYCVPAEGTYQACVTLNGEAVAGSPAAITAFR